MPAPLNNSWAACAPVKPRIDRTFVDAAGVRWIVDWKTSTHQGGDAEDFLDAELERYRGQLERYARAMKQLLANPEGTRPQEEQLAWFDACSKAAPWRVRARFGVDGLVPGKLVGRKD